MKNSEIFGGLYASLCLLSPTKRKYVLARARARVIPFAIKTLRGETHNIYKKNFLVPNFYRDKVLAFLVARMLASERYLGTEHFSFYIEGNEEPLKSGHLISNTDKLFVAESNDETHVCAALDVAHLGGADLTGADLTGANLKHADFTAANLTSVDFTGADLSTVIFTKAHINSVDFSNTKLTGETVQFLIAGGHTDFSHCVITGNLNLEAVKHQLDHVIFTRVDLENIYDYRDSEIKILIDSKLLSNIDQSINTSALIHRIYEYYGGFDPGGKQLNSFQALNSRSSSRSDTCSLPFFKVKTASVLTFEALGLDDLTDQLLRSTNGLAN